MKEKGTVLNLAGVKLIDTLLIGEGKKVKKVGIYKAIEIVKPEQIFLQESNKTLEAEEIKDICDKYSQHITKDFPLILLAKNEKGVIGFLEIIKCCDNHPKFNALNPKGLEFLSNTKLAVVIC